MQRSIEQARAALAERLRERRGEIEEALLNRTYAIADPKEAADPEYEQGLRAAVSAALDYGLAVVEQGEERAPQVPILLLAQARLAARNDIPLDTVLRRYFAGYSLLGDFIVQEAGGMKLGEARLKRLLRDQAALFDRFLAIVSEEYGREERMGPGSTGERRIERIERLLEGELVDPSDLAYELDAWHIGLVATGPDPAGRLQALAAALDRTLLPVSASEGTVWAWLGGRRMLPAEEVVKAVAGTWPDSITVALGEPGWGIAGWRLTHRQAQAALSVARRSGGAVARYADVGLLASILRDEVLTDSLHRLYIEPLAQTPGDTDLREALRTYIATGRNVSSTAAALGVDRRTVARRLHVIEEALGSFVWTRTAEIEMALRLWDLEDPPGSDP